MSSTLVTCLAAPKLKTMLAVCVFPLWVAVTVTVVVLIRGVPAAARKEVKRIEEASGAEKPYSPGLLRKLATYMNIRPENSSFANALRGELSDFTASTDLK